MRRSMFTIAVAVTFIAGACDTAGPLDPPAVATTDVFRSVQTDSTPVASPEEASEGGIMIGSGT